MPPALLVVIALLGLASLWHQFQPWRPDAVSGLARVIDGDSLVIAGREVRLRGIDAPEGRQTCTRKGAPWPCGEDARRTLQAATAGAQVTCRGSKEDQHRRLLAVCEAGGRDLNAHMVESGLALSFGAYQREEERARAGQLGLWSGDFERPQDWRRRNMRH